MFQHVGEAVNFVVFIDDTLIKQRERGGEVDRGQTTLVGFYCDGSQ